MATRFVRDENAVWRRPGFDGIAYSDGLGVEERLLQVISKARRVDTFAPELRQAITDWPSEYHLSRARHCLLRPLGIRPGERVLELGCGCGALTRYLGEMGAQVTAVEGNLARARITAERCRDLPTVRVYCDDTTDFETQARFDWVLLVGVIEYAPLFSSRKRPVEHYLRMAKRFLAPGGALVVAIENQLGLKYFNGCGEDHVGIPFFGLEGLYGSRTPITYGRRELARRIESCGFGKLEWFYPFPDYKLPSVIVGSRAFQTPGFDVSDLLALAQARDYGGRCVRLFEEALVMAVLHRNALVEDLSNSFVVVARREREAARPAGPLAWSYAVHRHEWFTTETAFINEGGRLFVRKTCLSASRESQGRTDQKPHIRQTLTSVPHSHGRLMIWRILEASARNASPDEMAGAFRPWFRELLSRATAAPDRGADPAIRPARLADYQIDGGLIDCTPFNIIERKDGLSLIDQEWKWDGKISLGHVVCRGILHSLTVPLVRSGSYDLAGIVGCLCRGESLTVSGEEISAWLLCEQEFLSEAGAPVPALSSMQGRRSDLIAIYPELVRRIQEASRLQGELAQEIAKADAKRTMINGRLARAALVKAKLRRELRKRRREVAALRQVRDVQCAALLALTRDFSDQAIALEAATRGTGCKAASDELAATRELVERTLCERDLAYETVAMLEQAHRRLLSSRSWRLTAPLRAVRTKASALAARVRR